MKKLNNVTYKTYDDSQVIIKRQINFKKEIAEAINKIIAKFKELNYGLKMNNDILVNIALSYYISFLEIQDEEEAMEILKNNVISYTLEEKDE